MNRLSNLIRNPKPSNTGPTMWTPNEPQNQVVQVGVDSIRLESTADGGPNKYVKHSLSLPAGDYVFSAFLENSSTGSYVAFDGNRVVVVTAAERGYALVGVAKGTARMTRYAAAFHLAADGAVDLRLQSPSVAAAVRYKDIMLCTLADWQKMRVPGFDYFDGDHATARTAIVYADSFPLHGGGELAADSTASIALSDWMVVA